MVKRWEPQTFVVHLNIRVNLPDQKKKIKEKIVFFQLFAFIEDLSEGVNL